MAGYYRLKNLDYTLASGAHIIPHEAFSAVEEANGLVEQAEAARDEILQAAQQSYHDERRRGYDEGQMEARLEAIAQLLYESHELDQCLLTIERDLTRLVSDCVRKLVGGFDDTARAEGLVRSALQQMRREKCAELRVPSHLHQYFRKSMASVLKEFPEVQLVDVVEDSALEADYIVLETSIGRVEGSVTQRLEDVVTVIRSAHVRASADALDALHSAGAGLAGKRS
jgi:type III secretion protein L